MEHTKHEHTHETKPEVAAERQIEQELESMLGGDVPAADEAQIEQVLEQAERIQDGERLSDQGE